MAGASIRIELDDAPLQRALKGLSDAGGDMAPAMDEIGSMLVSSVLDRFESGRGPDDKPWPPSRRALKQGGQTLVDSARLRDSVTHRFGADFVEVGTNVIYGAIHQFGGKAGRGHAATIPARPYLGVSPDDESEIIEILKDHILGDL